MLIKSIIKNLQIFSTIIVLGTTPHSINASTIDQTHLYQTTIEQESSLTDLNDYILQGITKVDNKYLVTAYDGKQENNSIIYVLDEQFEPISKKALDTSAHVGGIAYDENHNNIWITDIDGKVRVYDKNEILDNNNNIAIAKRQSINLCEEMNNKFGIKSIAYITIKDNKLYIGNFNDDNHTIIKEYEINDYGYVRRHDYRKFKLPGNIQGINFYEKNNETYLITSSSFGRLFNSKLTIYKYNEDEIDYRGKEIGTYSTPPMMEEIEITNDKLITVYESNAKKYQNPFNRYKNDFIMSNIDDIINRNKAKDILENLDQRDIYATEEKRRPK